MQPLQCAEVVVVAEPALSAATGLGRWFVDAAVLLNDGVSQMDVEVPLGNYSAQSPANVQVVSAKQAIGDCKVKCSLCCVEEQVWCSLYWVCGRAGQVVCGGLRLC